MLRVEKLSVAYGESLILRDVDLAVGPGALVCLLGRNGVGKTTLLKSGMGALPPRSGRSLVRPRGNDYSAAVDVTRAQPDARARAGIGYVPQGREIFPHLTVLENLRVGMLANPDRARTVPEQVFEYF